MSKRFLRSFTVLIIALALAFHTVTPASAAPPANDDFDSATSIGGVPTTITQETFDSTAAFDDPMTCTNNGSVWFSFTPSTDMILQANTFGSNYDTVLSAYTGARGALEQVPGGCNDDYQGLQSRIVFNVTGGTTYHFLVGFCCGSGGTGGGNLTFTLQEHEFAPPQVNFSFFPSDPSVFDTMTFFSNSFDPEGIGIQSYTWDFGDGTTGEGSSLNHTYAADGNYTVQHTVSTFDGRSASASQVVAVSTHDVSVTRLVAPQSARVGQTRTITVSIKNTRYPETVRIDLYRSIAGGGYELVGSSTQFVPVRMGNRTSEFSFNYTFSPQDAELGKVTFRAVVILIGARDALSADNEVVSTPPTKVTR